MTPGDSSGEETPRGHVTVAVEQAATLPLALRLSHVLISHLLRVASVWLPWDECPCAGAQNAANLLFGLYGCKKKAFILGVF